MLGSSGTAYRLGVWAPPSAYVLTGVAPSLEYRLPYVTINLVQSSLQERRQQKLACAEGQFLPELSSDLTCAVSTHLGVVESLPYHSLQIVLTVQALARSKNALNKAIHTNHRARTGWSRRHISELLTSVTPQTPVEWFSSST